MVHLVVKLIVFLQTCRTILLLHDVHLRRRDLHVEIEQATSLCDLHVEHDLLVE